MTMEERMKYNKKGREKYLRIQEKKKLMNQKKKQEKIELASKGVNCIGIAKEDVREDANVQRFEAQCGFC